MRIELINCILKLAGSAKDETLSKRIVNLKLQLDDLIKGNPRSKQMISQDEQIVYYLDRYLSDDYLAQLGLSKAKPVASSRQSKEE